MDRSGLTEPVNATDALLDPQRAPRPLERDHQPGRPADSGLRPRHRWRAAHGPFLRRTSRSGRAVPAASSAPWRHTSRRQRLQHGARHASSESRNSLKTISGLADGCRTSRCRRTPLDHRGSGRLRQAAPAPARVRLRPRRRRSRPATATARWPPRRPPPRAGAARRVRWARSRRPSGPRASAAGSAATAMGEDVARRASTPASSCTPARRAAGDRQSSRT